MRYLTLHYLAASLVLAAGPAQAANYVKLEGNQVDFYYDSDFWNLEAAVSGNSIQVRTDGVGRIAEVTEGAASPYPGPVYSADVSVNQAFRLALIAVPHEGYALTNDLGATASVTLRATGFSGVVSYGVANWYTSGEFVNGAFNGWATIGHDGAFRYAQFDGLGNDTNIEYGVPLELMTSVTRHQAIATGGTFAGYASTTGLGVAEAALNGINYSFSVTAVPEPQQYLLMGAGLALLGCAAKRRRGTMP